MSLFDAFEPEDRFMIISVFDGDVYEATQEEDEVHFEKLHGARDTFTNSYATVAMYARLGVYFVIPMELSPCEWAHIRSRVLDLNPDQRVAFGKEKAAMPPD